MLESRREGGGMRMHFARIAVRAARAGRDLREIMVAAKGILRCFVFGDVYFEGKID